MNLCPQTDLVQDYLDDELVPAERASFEAHLGSCRLCAAELAAYQGVFGHLETLPTWDPGPEFTERVLSEVLPPARVAWTRRAGFVYAGAVAASFAAIAAAIVLPAPRAWVGGLFSAATHSLVNSLAFFAKSIGSAFSQVALAMQTSGSLLARVAPIVRALIAPLAQPTLLLTLCAATLMCAAVLWWMRPRSERAARGMSDVGLLGL